MYRSWIYASHIVAKADTVEGAAIFLSSRHNNVMLDLTGHLHEGQDIYVQVLEGTHPSVDLVRRGSVARSA